MYKMSEIKHSIVKETVTCQFYTAAAVNGSVSWEPLSTSTPVKQLSKNVGELMRGKSINGLGLQQHHLYRHRINNEAMNKELWKNNSFVRPKQSFLPVMGVGKSAPALDIINLDSDESDDPDDGKVDHRKKLVIKVSSNCRTKLTCVNDEQTASIKEEPEVTVPEKRKRKQLEVQSANKKNIKIIKNENIEINGDSMKVKDEVVNKEIIPVTEKENQEKAKGQNLNLMQSNIPVPKYAITGYENIKLNYLRVAKNKVKTPASAGIDEDINNKRKCSNNVKLTSEVKNLVSEDQKNTNLSRRESAKDSHVCGSMDAPIKAGNLALEKTRESSHQLFSDSKEREFIESLDLTAVDIMEPEISFAANGSNANSVKKIKRKEGVMKKLIDSSNNGNGKKNLNDNERRPSRTRQPPRAYWMPRSENLSTAEERSESAVIAETEKSEDNSQKEEEQLGRITNPCEPLSSITDQAKIGEIDENMIVSDCVCIISSDELVAKEAEIIKSTNEIKPEKPSKEEVKKHDTTRIHSIKHQRDKTPRDQSKLKSERILKPKWKTMKPLKSQKPSTCTFRTQEVLAYKNFPLGFSTALTAQFKKFKSGILNVHSKASGATGENMHFEGVVLQGKVLMTVAEEGKVMEKGEIVHVAPRQKWLATNMVAKGQSVIYYWCGKFE